MRIEGLKREVERLKSLETDNPHSSIGFQLKAIKQTIETMNNCRFSFSEIGEARVFEEIKELLNIGIKRK